MAYYYRLKALRAAFLRVSLPGRIPAIVLSLSIFAFVASIPAMAASLAGPAVVTLRFAANVPANSPWDLGLRRLAAEFDRLSRGRVKVVFPPTAHVETESDIIQKMRLGIDGALLTTFGLAELYPDSFALSMPGFVVDDREFNAVLTAVAPLIRSRLGDRYIVLAISKGGWTRYFSKSPIVYPSDLAKLRISMDPSDEKGIQLLQSVGARVVTGSTEDFLLQINANEVDATCVSPIFVATLWSQLRGKIAYMSSFKVSPFIGAIVFNRSSWEKIPVELRPGLEKAVEGIAERLDLESAKLEEEAIDSLDGIQTTSEPADAASKWADMIAQRRDGLIARMFSPDILDTIDAALVKARTGKQADLQRVGPN
jgi:TRAP-type C4-dicarboxylate transport system substrate-binding protein